MQYRQLGKAGLKVSELSLGSWLTFAERLNGNQAKSCMKYAFDQGINFFDNAEVYANGVAEEVMALGLKQFRRESIVVATKIFWGGTGPNDIGLSRKHIIEGTRNSLKRLQLDYVDLVYCHRPDPSTPIEETVRAMDYIVRSGQAFYWGTSEWSAEEINTAFKIAKEIGCIPPSMEQPQYNLFHRQRVEKEYAPLFKNYQLGITSFGPLAFGVLSGKYAKGMPSNSRLTLYPEWAAPNMQERIAKTNELNSIAKKLNCSLAQLSIAWCLKKPNISSVILGASCLEQLQENMVAVTVAQSLTPNIIEEMELITADAVAETS